ncbi:MAG TPA: LysR family transcriptional regulator [Candidatus Baltobacteraceae bacterium]|nr:LysR family transcriptional regulator [Candidatus Baltobacteraceae bacterium]
MAISFAQLQALAALAQEGSFSKAARRLGVTQPAVTQHVANLAREAGVALVDVRSRRPVLTDAGEFLAGRARSILEAAAALEADMREFREARSGTLRVGATLTIGTYLLPALLARYVRDRPRVHVDVQIANTTSIAQMLHERELGLALVEGIVDDAAIVAVPFMQDEMVLTAPPSLLQNKRRVRAEELRALPFVSREPGSGTRDLGYESLVRSGVRPRVVLELPSVEAILHAVQAGLGVAILSRFAVEPQARAGAVSMFAISGLPLARSLFIAAVRGRTLSPAQRAFARIVLASDEGTAAFEAALFERRAITG